MEGHYGRGRAVALADVVRLRWLVAILGGAIVLAGIISLLPARRLHLSAPDVTIAFEAALTLLALGAAGLWLLGFGQDRRRSDLLVAGGLAVVGLTDFGLKVVPAVTVSPQVPDHLGISLAASLLAAVTLLVAALAPGEARLSRRRHALGLVAGLLVAGAALWLAVRVAGVRQSGSADAVAVAVRATAATIVAAFAAAALAFLMRWRDRREGIVLAVASLLLAIATLPRVRLPLMDRHWLTPADPLALAAFAAFLLAGALAHATTRSVAHRDVVDAERRRIANDLHDGLAQDLAFIVAYAERLAREHGDEHPVVIAARRALEVSRGVMIDLAASQAPSTEAALREVADELGSRFDVEVSVVGEPGRGEPAPAQRRQMVRIAREAIANAARHGDARRVEVTLAPPDPGAMLCIRDDGRGIAAATNVMSTGLGMAAMRERAASFGGRLVTTSTEGGGTAVSVVADE